MINNSNFSNKSGISNNNNNLNINLNINNNKELLINNS
jgi:hypothetical protein